MAVYVLRITSVGRQPAADLRQLRWLLKGLVRQYSLRRISVEKESETMDSAIWLVKRLPEGNFLLGTEKVELIEWAVTPEELRQQYPQLYADYFELERTRDRQ
jgi:hypothetical protein